ncbi:helix-turn-helix domain-containing protein [Prosthecochloris sp. SCSIO W1102]|uniref:helix-turn-helix domain-containing protein n=1 Tax=Prosthecochloris sp. SCSIO W1102 TaxID=2992243 RepID=UPI00223E000E|nr:helix-turn-helix domain-containing protein [Prosthecochloris sp. SCSIO W1102]UZJ39972.1 helix-turn-helix domain-containing protein [Prosthecochloris sp. SCSIO W1102]
MEKNNEKTISKQLTFEQLPAAVSNILNQLNNLTKKIEPFLQSAQQERPMGVEDCAALLAEIEGRDVTSAAVYNRVNRGRIPYHKDGGRLYFFESEILEALRKGETKTLDQRTDEYFSQTA